MAEVDAQVTSHYSRGDLAEAVLAALRAAGKDLDRLTPDDLAPMDEFHGRGRAATVELADLAKVTASDRVLDVGCGIGGPSRYLAHRYGCKVSGIDLTVEFIAVAQMLEKLTKLDHLVDYRQASATGLPFPDASFDLVWSQNVAMNIADRHRYYGELRRVVKPGGRIGISEVLAGPNGTPYLPAPWARDPAVSFVLSEDEVRRRMAEAGLKVAAWVDTSHASSSHAAQRAASMDAPPPLGVHVLLGAAAPEIYRNGQRSYADGRMRSMTAMLTRAD
jgi:SAM-dependent methyltransferase